MHLCREPRANLSLGEQTELNRPPHRYHRAPLGGISLSPTPHTGNWGEKEGSWLLIAEQA